MLKVYFGKAKHADKSRKLTLQVSHEHDDDDDDEECVVVVSNAH